MLELVAVPLGLVIGTIGSLTGIGGGFLLMPVLLLVFPDRSAAGLAVITMTVVFLMPWRVWCPLPCIGGSIGKPFSLTPR